MTAQHRPMENRRSAFDSVQAWLTDAHKRKPVPAETAALATDLRALSQRVERVRALSAATAGVELSPYVKNLVKMVGSLEMIPPPSEWS